MVRFLIIFVLTFYFGLNLTAQLTLTHSPESSAFIAQDKSTRSAQITLKGEVNSNTYNQLNIKVYRDNVLLANHAKNLYFTNGIASFTQTITLKTGKYFYKIEYNLSGGATFTQTIDDLLVGDIYLIQGQSNAVAASYNAFNTSYNSPYLRSYGTASRTINNVRSDTFWHPFNAVNVATVGSVGQWGAVMARNLLDSFNTPICLLNGAVGGTRVSQHQPNLANREDLSTIYGRLLYRVRKANLDRNISGILYFQGESDGWNAVGHDVGFTNLHGYWEQDFPGFKKLYVVQVRDGCGNPTLQLREVQRQFEFKLPNCQTVSANGLNNHDNCHYGFVNGYEKLGYQMSKLVARDYYWPKEQNNINPPNIDYAFYSDGLQKEITLVMHNPTDLVIADNNFESLFQIEGDASVQITAGRIEKNKVILSLNKSSCNITGLSYDGKRGTQPWVTGLTGMGLITFYNVPIKNHNIPTHQFACKNELVSIGTTKLPHVNYSITQLSNLQTQPSALIGLKLKNNDSFLLTMQYDSLDCLKKDSVIIYVEVDDILLPELRSDTTLCLGDSLALAPSDINFAQFNWKQGARMQSSFTFKTKEAGEILLSALSIKGCLYNSSTQLSIRNPITPLQSQYSICNSDTLHIVLTDTFSSYLWDNAQGNSTFISNNPGQHTLKLTDSLGCIVLDSFNLNNYPQSSYLLADTICTNETVRINKPYNAINWQRNRTVLNNFFFVQGKQTIPLELTDSNHCLTEDTFKITEYPQVSFPSIIDTLICRDNSFELQLPMNMKAYYLDARVKDNHIITIPTPGQYSYSFKDTNHCNNSGTLQLGYAQDPYLSFINDTSICESDSIMVWLDSTISYQINGLAATGWAVFKPNTRYTVNAESNCTAQKEVFIQSLKCTSSINRPSDFRISPIPFQNHFQIEALSHKAKSIYIYSNDGKLVWYKTKNINTNEIIDLTKNSDGLYILLIDNSKFTIQKLK